VPQKGVFLLGDKMKKTKHNKKEDGNFQSTNKKHGHKESARDVFGQRNEKTSK
jgi:hypothetical protein